MSADDPSAPLMNYERITKAPGADISADIENPADATDDAPATIAPPVISLMARGLGARQRYVCSVCGIKFPRPSGLKSHSHTGEILYMFACNHEGFNAAFTKLLPNRT
ncbi:hypothetical protein RUND412_010812 [Rhizina undulata]